MMARMASMRTVNNVHTARIMGVVVIPAGCAWVNQFSELVADEPVHM